MTLPRIVHQAVVGLGGNGFRATCTCGWRSHESWDRPEVARARDDHKQRMLVQEVR